MEEKRFDPYQFIGFFLIALILTWMLYRNDSPKESVNNDVSNTILETKGDKKIILSNVKDSVSDVNYDRIGIVGE